MVIDFLIWYMLYIVILFVLFLLNHELSATSGNLMYYQEVFHSMTGSSNFIILYVGCLLFYEIAAVILWDGQSLSKRILHLRVLSKKNKISSLVIRGIVKLLIVNPFGVAAVLLYRGIPIASIELYAYGMLFLFVVNTGCVLFYQRGISIQDFVGGTSVIEVRRI